MERDASSTRSCSAAGRSSTAEQKRRFKWKHCAQMSSPVIGLSRTAITLFAQITVNTFASVASAQYVEPSQLFLLCCFLNEKVYVYGDDSRDLVFGARYKPHVGQRLTLTKNISSHAFVKKKQLPMNNLCLLVQNANRLADRLQISSSSRDVFS